MTTAFLEHLNGESVGKRVELADDSVVIGTGTDCDIVPEAVFRTVSRRHAVLTGSPAGWTITDVGTEGQGSTFGTLVNGQRLTPNRPYPLKSGDEIRLGGVSERGQSGKQFRFRGGGTIDFFRDEATSLPGRLRLDAGKRIVLLDNRPLPLRLAPLKFELLLMLWERRGEVCTFREIWERLWPDEPKLPGQQMDKAVRVRINTLAYDLRQDLKPALGMVDVLESSRGRGYRLRL